MVTIVVAYNKHRTIGNAEGVIPWHIPEDLKHFKETTTGHICVMGRKTWESIPTKYRPLPDRENVILTRDPEVFMAQNPGLPANVHVICDLGRFIEQANEWSEIYIIGGGEIYKLALEEGLVDYVLASVVKDDETCGPVYFHELDGWEAKQVTNFEQFDLVRYEKVESMD